MTTSSASLQPLLPGRSLAGLCSAPAAQSGPSVQGCRLHGGCCRSSAAGKALYTLYGGDLLGRKQGNIFSQNNLARVQARKDTGWMPPPPGKHSI